MTNLTMTDADSRRLRALLEHASNAAQDRANWEALADEIDKANVVRAEDIPADVVTMHSRVRIVDLRTGEQRVFELVYPSEANYAENKISVLAPIGMALLGYSAGTEISWNVPSGIRRLRIEAVEHQPEAAKRRNAA